jgi:hypothetical protein
MADACKRDVALGDNGAANHRDTPPVDEYVVEAGLLARRSSLASGLPEAFASVTSVDANSPLTVAGAAPALPDLDRNRKVHRLPS